jgi:OHCU decarboxylase
MVMDQADFLARFGAVFEHSPWVAEAVFESGGGVLDDAEALGELFESVFLSSDPARQLATLVAHPPLACAPADAVDMTANSANEQSAAGLDRCSPAEFAEFSRLNKAYAEKFGFPFVIAVKGLTRGQILSAFRERLANERAQEFQTALLQTCRIARFRIRDMHDA